MLFVLGKQPTSIAIGWNEAISGRGLHTLKPSAFSRRTFANNHQPHTARKEKGLPLPQREAVGVGFDASYPDLLLAGLPRRGDSVYGSKCDGHFVGFGERWVTDPPLIKMDCIA